MEKTEERELTPEELEEKRKKEEEERRRRKEREQRAREANEATPIRRYRSYTTQCRKPISDTIKETKTMTNLSISIANNLEALRAAEKQVAEALANDIDRAASRGLQYTPDGYQRMHDEHYTVEHENSVVALADAVVKAIDEAITATSKEQAAETTQRLRNDPAYLAVLSDKIDLVLGYEQTPDKDFVKELFTEYTGDSATIHRIETAVLRKFPELAGSLPVDQKGMKQKHLSAVRKLAVRYIGLIREAETAKANQTFAGSMVELQDAEITAFIGYCKQQAPDFSKPDSEVLEAVAAKAPACATGCAKLLWDLHRLSGVMAE